MSLNRDKSLQSLPYNKVSFDFDRIRPISKRLIKKSLTPIKALSRPKDLESKALNELVDTSSSISHPPKTLSYSQEISSYRSAPSLRKPTVEVLQHSRLNSARDLEKLKELKVYEELKSMNEKQQRVRNKYKVKSYLENTEW